MTKDETLGAYQICEDLAEDPPTLSVVILTYNSASTLEICLDSLVAQVDTDFETIIVDDDSTDETVSIASGYSSRLRLTVVKNGSHNIPRGRNIGLNQSKSDIVAFIDSDDSAAPDWTRVIVNTFSQQPDLAMIAGDLIPAYRTGSAESIAMVDTTVRDLIGRGVMRFAAGNCAINQNILPGGVFDEEFRAAEDLELISRVQRSHPCAYIPTMLIRHTSRDTFRQYAKQMYHYGFMKVYFAYCDGAFRLFDYVPLAVIIVSIIAGIVFAQWWMFSAIFVFSLLEALLVIAYKRCRVSIALLTFPAWLTKNVAWSVGVGQAVLSLMTHSGLRHKLRGKRAEPRYPSIVGKFS